MNKTEIIEAKCSYDIITGNILYSAVVLKDGKKLLVQRITDNMFYKHITLEEFINQILKEDENN